MATWKDDPEFTELEQRYVSRKARALLVNCSYGGILYKELRCAWVHEFLPRSEEISTTEDDQLDNESLAARIAEPYYRYMSNRDQFLLMIPVSFLAATLERAINSFEQEAQECNILPFAR